mmetsp:Transcript_23730/g.49960  ORF Transcript_23730/g.49960 Transcript_23730/m.49960 type:complete len:163 (+) Transcript_23730:442-930(+)
MVRYNNNSLEWEKHHRTELLPAAYRYAHAMRCLDIIIYEACHHPIFVFENGVSSVSITERTNGEVLVVRTANDQRRLRDQKKQFSGPSVATQHSTTARIHCVCFCLGRLSLSVLLPKGEREHWRGIDTRICKQAGCIALLLMVLQRSQFRRARSFAVRQLLD